MTALPTPPPGRVPPHDLDAERAVLSAIMLERDALDRVSDILAPEDFYGPDNRLIFSACLGLSEAKQPIDAVTVASWLKSRDRIAQVGGIPALSAIADAAPSVANLEAYAGVVREKSRVRKLISACHGIAAEGYGDIGAPQEWLDAAEQKIFGVVHEGVGADDPSDARDCIRDIVQQISDNAARGRTVTGTSTGFWNLDELTSGMQDGEVTIVAARPGMGKTAFAMAVAVNASSADPDSDRKPVGVYFASLEMPKSQLALRAACSEAGVNILDARRGRLTGDAWSRFQQAALFVSTARLRFDDVTPLTVMRLRARVRREAARCQRMGQRLGLVIVDYLQLMSGPSTGDRRNTTRESEVSAISRGLKLMAKELGLHVMALSQLNRSGEAGKTVRMPQLSDVRESGAIEQDADVVVFVHGPHYYDKTQPTGAAEIVIAKQRHGPTCSAYVGFQEESARFYPLDERQVLDILDRKKGQ